MNRIRIVDIVRETGLSRATVDRVLNNRAGVHPRTRAMVEAAMQTVADTKGETIQELRPVDVVLRLGTGLGGQIKDAFKGLEVEGGRLYDMYQRNEDAVVSQVRELCSDVSRPLILCVKDTDPIRSTLGDARKRGKKVVALISEQSTEVRDAFVGIDNRAAGQTAAFLAGRSLRDRPAEVGVVLGDFAFRCHEDREMGFRGALRARFPHLTLVAEASGEDNPDQTYQAVLAMIKEHPKIAAIYNLSGGNAGLARALNETSRADDILVISHEATSVTVPLLRSGSHDYLISQDPGQLMNRAVQTAQMAATNDQVESVLLDFCVHTPFNIPSYGDVGKRDPG